MLKFNKLFTIKRNSSNGQYNFSLKKKELAKYGLTPEQLYNQNISIQINKKLGNNVRW